MQPAPDHAEGSCFDASGFGVIKPEVAGNGKRYNLHPCTSTQWLSPQSCRASFVAGAEWGAIRIPFREFEAYRSKSRFQVER